jgi:hypothetical protein
MGYHRSLTQTCRFTLGARAVLAFTGGRLEDWAWEALRNTVNTLLIFAVAGASVSWLIVMADEAVSR